MGFPGEVRFAPALAGRAASVGFPAAAAHEHHDTEQNGYHPADQA
jgi:hypothetical protein